MKVQQTLILVLLTILAKNIIAATSVDLRSEYETWNSGVNGKNSALLFGLGGMSNITPTLSITAGFVTGEHENNSDFAQGSLKRTDADIALGYRIQPNISIFAGYRLIKIDYRTTVALDRSFTDITHGLGIGIGAFQPIFLNTMVYGRLVMSGLLSTLDSQTTGIDRGLGLSSGIEAGFVYQIISQTNIGFAIKQQSTTIDYGNDSSRWNHNYLRIGISLSHQFH